ncbi:class I SAM-dependent methyltransferase [Myxococcota bacterium]|nr:class I SAM-dependent methyltransferase [Myxococcota bacterium]
MIYRSPALYELLMRVLYATHYRSRLRAISELIEDDCEVVDLCCGPGALYRLELRGRGIDYTGLDINPRFVARLQELGANSIQADVAARSDLPKGDYLIMLSSLYQFLPGNREEDSSASDEGERSARLLVERMLEAARSRVIIAEPIRNFAQSRNPVLRRVASRLTNPGTADQPVRFDEQSLDGFFDSFEGSLERCFAIPGGREKVYVLRGRGQA